MLFVIFALLTFLLMIATFITLWRYEVWWVRGWDFPRLQIAIFALLLLGGEMMGLNFSHWADYLIVALTTLCVFYQGWWILPYTRIFPNEVKSIPHGTKENTVSIMASNVLTTNKNAAALLREVRQHNPDILVTLETNRWWQEQLSELEADYPYTLKCPLENLYGMHVYSRFPLEEAETEFLIQEDVPSMHALVVLADGIKVRVHFLHPAPPSPTENDESSERDAELLLIAKKVAKSNLPVIVAGDLNDVAWSATTRLFRKISGLLDPRVGRGMFNSFHAGHRFIRWPLDHLFHSDHFVLVDIKRLANIGSDHFPMFIKLAYFPEKGKAQEGIKPNAEEEHWADKKIQNKKP